MPSRFIFSLRFSSKVMMKLAKLSLAMVLFMSLFRLNVFLLSTYSRIEQFDFLEVLQAFGAGIRFDLLIFGFLLLPIYFILMIQAVCEKWPNGMFIFYKIYFGAIWLIISLLSFVDFFHYALHGRRMRFAEYSSWTPQFTLEQMQSLPMNQILVFSIITVVLLSLGYMLICAVNFGQWKDEYSPQKGSKIEMALRIVLPLLAIVLAARGTVEAHHLALEHSLVSHSTALNEMALNAVWCFDK
ncbi:hypothetical protein ACLVWU_01280 [Bdellovibrio sp. HCB290]|uniref:hypothetical protein n=1 Tax=Bdellovibrio sp. HCB290 TaxID=3394356 RepID=UPI0039B65096